MPAASPRLRRGLLAFVFTFLLALIAVPATAGAYVYWVDNGGTIGRAELDGTGVNSNFFSVEPGDIYGFARDAGHIYYSNDGAGVSFHRIGRVNVDGTGANTNHVPDVIGHSTAWGIAVDDSHIYWADLSGAIGRSNLDGSDANLNFITGIADVINVAVDGDHIYWVSNGTKKIGRANLDGTGVDPSFVTSTKTVSKIAVDGGHIYWSAVFADVIGRANIDGSGVDDAFINTADGPIGIAVDAGHVYWANSGSIGRANLDGTAANNAFIPGVGATELAVAPDLEPPNLTIDSGPSGPTKETSPSFAFTGGLDATLSCSIDRGTAAFEGCSGAGTHEPASPLTDGTYTFRVKATDDVGNEITRTRSFSVDTAPPATAIMAGPTGPTGDDSPEFVFGSDDGSATFDCRLDGGEWATCAPPKLYLGLADGAHTFEARATDPAGNHDPAPPSRSFTVDTTPPSLAISSGPSGTTTDSTPTFGFSAGPEASVVCSIDQGRPAFGPCSSATSHTPATALAVGNYTFTVRATDAAGNHSDRSRVFSVASPTKPPPGDTTAPVTRITAAPKATIKTKAKTARVAVSFSSEPRARLECRLDASPFKPCSSTFSVSARAKKGKGAQHTISIRATDAAGNVGKAAVVSFRVIRKG